MIHMVFLVRLQGAIVASSTIAQAFSRRDTPIHCMFGCLQLQQNVASKQQKYFLLEIDAV